MSKPVWMAEAKDGRRCFFSTQKEALDFCGHGWRAVRLIERDPALQKAAGAAVKALHVLRRGFVPLLEKVATAQETLEPAVMLYLHKHRAKRGGK